VKFCRICGRRSIGRGDTCKSCANKPQDASKTQNPCPSCAELRARITQLKDYVQHAYGCAVMRWQNGGVWSAGAPKPDCTCGLGKLVSSPEPQEDR
jgi:hypothetical protein